MADKDNTVRKTIISNSLPVLLSIILFIFLISAVIIPFIKEALLNQKKDAVRKMIESAYSFVDRTYNEYIGGDLSEEEAQKKAVSILNDLRYDEGMSNYFWINTIEPNDVSLLIMHPYRLDLVGSDVMSLKDPYGVFIFRDIIELVRENGEGYTSYHWQYMDDPHRIEPKISFVKLFEPWNWIIGTGLYLDDITREINQITDDISRFISIVLVIIVLLLFYNAYTTIRMEKEKNSALQKLYDSRQYLSSLFDLLPMALFSCDEKWIVRSCNERALLFLDKPPESIIEKSLYSLIPQTKAIVEEIGNHPAQLREEVFEKRIIDVHDEEIISNITVFAVSQEEYPEFVVLIDDITVQVQKENQLVQAQKMETVGNLVGGIAHDFNNILGGIIGASSIIRDQINHSESLNKDQLRENLSIIDEAGNRAADMVQQLLSLSRKQESHFSAQDLNTPLRDVYKICTNSFDKCIDIKILTYHEPAAAMVNITMIKQVLLNLCINANHAMTLMRRNHSRMGGTLTLQLTKVFIDDYYRQHNPEAEEDEYWCIIVQDTGIGIEKKNLVKIFEPFFTTKDKDHGTGLGLSMVYNIVKQHKGFIDVYSEKDKGTSVKIYLPILAVEKDEEFIKPKEGSLLRGAGTVLVVDDDKNIRHLAVEILESCGYNTLDAADGDAGVALFKENIDLIDLVYLDIIMPKKSGVEAFYAIRKMSGSVRILLSSGFKKDDQVSDLLEKGVDGFLQKPFTAHELSRHVYDILNRD